MPPPDPARSPAAASESPGRLVPLAGLGLACAAGLLAWADARWGWVETAFDAVAHLFFEVPMLARVRRPTQVPLVRVHLVAFSGLTAAGLLAWRRLSPHARACWGVFLVAYALRAAAWVAGGNVPLVP